MEEVSAVVNSTVFLRCHVRGTPPPSVSWLKDGLLLHSNTHYHFQENGGVLEIVDVQVSDMAGYLCVAENKVGAVQKLYSLSVHVPPGIVGEREEAVSVVEGHMVSLLCDVQAYPAAEITWTRDGEVLQFSTGAHVLPGGQMLQLPRAQQQDAGQYVCTATNSAGQDQKSILLSVYVPPTLLPHSGSEVMTPLLGSAVTLHCEAQGVPEPEVTWYHNGQQLTAEGGLLLNQQQLKIAGVQVADGGIYTCRVSNPAGQLERTFRLTVHVPPAVVGPLHETLAHTLGSRVRLVCDVTGVPTPAVSWLKDGTAIGVGVGVLDFGPLELSHAGTYTCVARNSEGQSEKNFSLTVHVSPTVVDVGPAEVSGFLGESLSLECRAEGSPAPHLRWFRNGAELDSTHSKHIDVSPDGHSLTIRNLRADDSGTFSCLAVSPAGQDSRIYTVFVLVPPVILGDGDVQIEPVEGSVVTLECKVTGTPPPQVSWFRDGQPLLLTPRTHVLPTHTVLRISRVSLSDSGLYVCVAQSRAGTAERRFHLQVPAPPTVDRTEPTEQVSVILGSVVTLSCEAHGVPPPTLTWLKDGRPLLFNHNQLPDGQETHFQLPAVSRSDSGLYSCLASNPAGSTTKAFNLTVLEPPRLVGQLGTEQKLVAVDGVLELECIAEGIPPPTLSWLKDGRPLEDSTAVVERNGQLLKINKAQVEDAGVYTCLASSPAGEDGRSHWVRIQLPPTLLGSSDIRTVTVPVRGQVTLRCQTDGDPSTEIEWYKDDVELQFGSRFQSIAGATSLQFVVEVLLPPVIREGGSLITAHVSQNVVLPCEVEGQTAPAVLWRKDGGPVPVSNGRFSELPEGSLQIQSVQLVDAGRYYCSVSSPAGSAQRSMELRVYVGPTIGPGPLNLTLTTGLRAVLSCENTGIPAPQVTWKRNGSPINTQSGAYRLMSSGSLVIISPSHEDEGYFECIVTNEVGEERRIIEVILQVPPSIEDDVTTVTAIKMSPVVLPCHATGSPEPTISWTKSGAQLGTRGGSYRILPTGTGELALSIRSVFHCFCVLCKRRLEAAFRALQAVSIWRLKMSGRRTVASNSCVVSNIGWQHQSFSLLWRFSCAVIREGGSLITAHVSQNVVLPCEVEGQTAPAVLWRKDGGPVPVSNGRFSELPEGSLQIQSVQLVDAGRYYCSVSSPAGSAQRSMELRVYVGPTIGPGPLNLTLTTGLRAVLSCENTGIPAPQVTWKRNGSPINTQSGAYRLMSSGSLVIISPSHEDEGYFECIVTNEVGEERRIIEVILQVPPSIEDDVTTVTAIKMSPVVLPCHATGSPEPTISWTKSGAQLGTRGGSYRILPTDTPAPARNPVGVAHKHITLAVHEPPEIRPMVDEVQVVLHQGAVLPCEVHGFPRPTVTWQREGVPIATGNRLAVLSSGALKFSQVTLGDGGTYQCLAQNAVGTAVGRTRLVLQVPPVLSVPRQEYVAVIGQSVNLECVADGQPRPEVLWHRGRRPVVEGTHLQLFSNGTLYIPATQRSDAGLYTCSARNAAGRASQDVRLFIQVPPMIPGGQSEMSVIQGFQALLPCVAQGLPEPKVQWKRDGTAVPDLPGKFTVLRSGELIIERAEPGDAGVFTCVATNPAGSAHHSVHLAVNMRPAFKELPGDMTLNVGQSLTLSCHAQGTPSPTVTWTVNSHPYTGATVDESGRSSLLIENVTVSDAGTYVCAAENTVGTVKALSFVRVTEPPILRGEAHLSQTVSRGGLAVLDCPVRGNPVPVLRWHKDNSPLLGSERFHPLRNGSLAIYGAMSGDSGVYRCVAESEAGIAERTISLKVKVPGGFSNWEDWGPCSVTCGRGIQERFRSCTNPVPTDGGPPCEGPNVDVRECQTSLCSGEAPRRARGSLIGIVNDQEFGVAFLEVNITENLEQGTSNLQAHVDNIPPSVGPLMRVLVSVFAPVYWTTVLQTAETQNGFSVSHGHFRQESQLEFETGEILKLTHVARGVDAEGVLLVDMVINGFIPSSLSSSWLSLQDFDESYVQTGSGQLYAWSSQNHLQDGVPVTLRCNHSLLYEGPAERQGALLQLVRLTDISGTYSLFSLSLHFQMTASLVVPEGGGETCPKGFVLDTASYCADEDECAVDSGCSHSCTNIMGGFTCTCPSGFSISTHSNTCQDIDECAEGSHMCHSNQQCVNTVGRYRCQAQCGPGFKPSSAGSSCEDVDECQESSVSPCQHQCFNTLGSFRCACRPGYQLVGHRCLDVNECLQSVCPVNQQCRNTEGGYQCFESCPAGMTQSESGVCSDVDECEDGSHACRYSQICQNTLGGYTCVCPRGFRSQGVGRPCADIDECVQTPSPCAYQCRNVPGSFRCVCPPGTVLLGDGRSCAGLERGRIVTNGTRYHTRLRPQLVSTLGRPFLTQFQAERQGPLHGPRNSCPTGFTNKDGTCVDVDECVFRKPCQHECRNTAGSFQCLCPSGYQLLPNGRTCQDIDECTEKRVQCGPNQMCFNTRGGYQCLDTPCPASYQRGGSPGTCYRPCSPNCAAGASPLLLQYKLLTLPLGIPAQHNVIRLTAFSEAGVLQERTSFTILEQGGEIEDQPFGIKDEAGRGIIFTMRTLDHPGLVRLRVQATTLSEHGRITYQSIFIIYISISMYPY
ncbi:hypothetical protein SRHO_G00329570 [Serrasalmus rhombeus]